MARSIQDINTVALILELQNGGCNGNSALLFNLHPVGDRMLGRLSSLYRSRQINRASVQQEFLRKGCFSGVRMRDDRKGPPSFYFIRKA